MKKILLYMPETTGPLASSLGEVVRNVAGEGGAEVCCCIRDLGQALRSFWAGYALIILCARDSTELEELIVLQELMEDLPVILVLPDENDRSVRRAHLLRPRFLTYITADRADIHSVLAKMYRKVNSENCSESGGHDEKAFAQF